jgi:hypothetical protein
LPQISPVSAGVASLPPEKWDPRYQTVISSHDPKFVASAEGATWSAITQGHYIYTGLAVHELPAEVPGPTVC